MVFKAMGLEEIAKRVSVDRKDKEGLSMGVNSHCEALTMLTEEWPCKKEETQSDQWHQIQLIG